MLYTISPCDRVACSSCIRTRIVPSIAIIRRFQCPHNTWHVSMLQRISMTGIAQVAVPFIGKDYLLHIVCTLIPPQRPAC